MIQSQLHIHRGSSLTICETYASLYKPGRGKETYALAPRCHKYPHMPAPSDIPALPYVCCLIGHLVIHVALTSCILVDEVTHVSLETSFNNVGVSQNSP